MNIVYFVFVYSFMKSNNYCKNFGCNERFFSNAIKSSVFCLNFCFWYKFDFSLWFLYYLYGFYIKWYILRIKISLHLCKLIYYILLFNLLLINFSKSYFTSSINLPISQTTSECHFLWRGGQYIFANVFSDLPLYRFLVINSPKYRILSFGVLKLR